MRRAVPFAILAGCLGVGVLPALAANGAVTIRDNAFAPGQVAVLPGESVTWTSEGGRTANPHSVHFEGEVAPIEPESTRYDASRTFPTAGQFRYFCDVHPSSMRGTVHVNASGTVPSPSPTTSPTASPTGSPAPSPSSTAAPGGGGTSSPAPAPSGGGTAEPGAQGGTAVSSFRARAARSSFCTRRSARCRRPGVFLRLDLGATSSVRVRGTLRRGSRRVRSVSLLARPGSRRVRLPGRRLKPGRYALTLRAGDITRRVRFRVRSS